MKKLLGIIKLCILGALLGILGGFVGACFAHLLSFVTNLRQENSWLVLLLPVGAVVTAALYHLFDMKDHAGANEIILCLASNKQIRPTAAPLIFISTTITHLLGGSAGREGAALQLGGAGAAGLCILLRLKVTDRIVVVLCGMSAVFASLFGTPLTAALFVLEFRLKPKVTATAILPCIIAATIASKLSAVLGVEEEAVILPSIDSFSFSVVAKIIVLALGICVIGYLMCYIFHHAAPVGKRLIGNDFLRAVIFSVVIIILTAITGDMRYNGSGMPMALDAVYGNADWYDFLLKIIFTAVTLAAGLKGGEIVPTFCIGATFGCFFGGLLGLNPGFAAMLGLVGLFSCVTNSPVSGIILGAELFGIAALPYYILVCLVLWPISMQNGLFKNRTFQSISVFRKKAIRKVTSFTIK